MQTIFDQKRGFPREIGHFLDFLSQEEEILVNNSLTKQELHNLDFMDLLPINKVSVIVLNYSFANRLNNIFFRIGGAINVWIYRSATSR
ncbi:MAG: hypothetical protein M3413_01675 [Bacteroidota bacterium]|jgi:hypothetical protein|nr:hypothetical protein [Bacteroidota bacterium]